MSKVVGAFQSLWAQPKTAAKQDTKFAKVTTKVVGRPLSVLYGTAALHGNIVLLRQYDDDHHRQYFVALCWGPVDIDPASVTINGKNPSSVNGVEYHPGTEELDNVYVTTSKGFRGDNSEDLPNTPWPVGYGMNRCAFLWVRGLANPTFSGLDALTVAATRPDLFKAGGESADYDTPIPDAIAAAWPSGIRSSNPVAAALDYLLNRDYGPGVPAAAFGDCATWLAAAARCEQPVVNPDGSTEPRYTVGLEVGSDDSDGTLTHEAIVESLLDYADCKIFESGGVLKVWQAQAQAPVGLVLDDSNFEPSGFATGDIKDRPNLVEVVYQDDDDGQKQSVSFLDDAGIDVSGENRKVFQLPGIPSRTQAARRARLEGRRAVAEARTLEGEAAPAARQLEPGDVVPVTLRDADNTWYDQKLFRVVELERTDGDQYGLKLTLQEYGGDDLYDDGQDNVLEANDPILRTPSKRMPSPLERPLPAQAGSATTTTILDQDGRVTHVVELAWQAAGEPAYMHAAWHVYRRVSLSDPWSRVGSATGAPYFRDTGAPVLASDVYYGVTAVTSMGVEGDVPALWTAKAPRIGNPNGVDPSTITFSYGSKATGQDGLYAWLEVDWGADDEASRYQVYYSFDGGPLLPVTEEEGTSARIEPARVGLYEVTIVSLGQDGGRSGEATAAYLLQDGGWDPPDAVQDLALLGDVDAATRRFFGRDCRLGWGPSANARFSGPQLDHYEVEVSIQGRTVRTESVVDASYAYPYDHNLADSAQFGTPYASRQLSFAVYAVDRAGRRSPPATLDAANPQAGLPAAVATRQGLRSCVLDATAPAESDLLGMRVVVGPDPLFDPEGGQATQVADGVDTHVVVSLLPGQTLYAKAAFYDVFGKDGLAWTPAYDVSAPRLVADDIEAGAISSQNLADDVLAALEEGGVTVVGSLPALPDPAFPTGSQVYLLGSGKLYRNAEGTWSAAVDGADILANSITAGRMQVGAIGADDLAANAVTAGKVAIGDFSNICANPTFAQGLDGWTLAGGQTAAGIEAYASAPPGCPAPAALRLTVPSGANSRLYWKEIQVEAGDTYYLSAQVARTGTSLRELTLGGKVTDNAGASTAFLDAPSGSATGRVVPPTGGWAKVEWQVTIPTGVTRFQPSVYVTTGTDAASDYHVTLVRVRKMTASVLIENGAVTADKCTARLIRAGSALIDTAAIDSAMIADLDAAKLRAGTAIAGLIEVGPNGANGERVEIDGALPALKVVARQLVGAAYVDRIVARLGKLASGAWGIELSDPAGALLFSSASGLNVGNNPGFGPFATAAQISPANIDDLIASGAIAGTKIAAAAIGTAHIQNLAVDTLQVKDGAITNPASVYGPGQSSSSAGSLDTPQCPITTSGGSVFVFATFQFSSTNASIGAQETLQAILRLNGSSIANATWTIAQAFAGAGNPSSVSGATTIAYVDTPPAGTNIYRVRLNHGSGPISYSKCTMFVIEFKK